MRLVRVLRPNRFLKKLRLHDLLTLDSLKYITKISRNIFVTTLQTTWLNSLPFVKVMIRSMQDQLRVNNVLFFLYFRTHYNVVVGPRVLSGYKEFMLLLFPTFRVLCCVKSSCQPILGGVVTLEYAHLRILDLLNCRQR